MGARLKIVTVNPQEMWKALSTPASLWPLYVSRIPDGAVVRSVHIDHTCGLGMGMLAITLEHPSWPLTHSLGPFEKVTMGFINEGEATGARESDKSGSLRDDLHELVGTLLAMTVPNSRYGIADMVDVVEEFVRERLKMEEQR